MEILFWYVLCAFVAALYIKVMHSKDFWQHFILGIGLSPLIVIVEVFSSEPKRIWSKRDVKASGSSESSNASSLHSYNPSSSSYRGRTADELKSSIIFDTSDECEEITKCDSKIQTSDSSYKKPEPVQEERSTYSPSYHNEPVYSSSSSSRDDSSSSSSSDSSSSSSSYD